MIDNQESPSKMLDAYKEGNLSDKLHRLKVRLGQQPMDYKTFNDTLGMLEQLAATQKALDSAVKARQWISTKERLPTRFDNSNDYCQIDCLVVQRDCIKHLVWNCEHNCWDDDSGDDWYCEPMAVEYWQPFPELPTPPEAALANIKE